MVAGSCLCGGIRYRIGGRISGIVDCHCSMCRKAAGGPFASFFVANRRDIEWQGEELLEPGETLILAANTLDDDPGVAVIAEEHVASKAPWHRGAEDAPRHDRGFPGWATLEP